MRAASIGTAHRLKYPAEDARRQRRHWVHADTRLLSAAIDRISHAEHALAAARDDQIADHRNLAQHRQIQHWRRRNHAINIEIVGAQIVRARAGQTHCGARHAAFGERHTIIGVDHVGFQRIEADAFTVQRIDQAGERSRRRQKLRHRRQTLNIEVAHPHRKPRLRRQAAAPLALSTGGAANNIFHAGQRTHGKAGISGTKRETLTQAQRKRAAIGRPAFHSQRRKAATQHGQLHARICQRRTATKLQAIDNDARAQWR